MVARASRLSFFSARRWSDSLLLPDEDEDCFARRRCPGPFAAGFGASLSESADDESRRFPVRGAGGSSDEDFLPRDFLLGASAARSRPRCFSLGFWRASWAGSGRRAFLDGGGSDSSDDDSDESSEDGCFRFGGARFFLAFARSSPLEPDPSDGVFCLTGFERRLSWAGFSLRLDSATFDFDPPPFGFTAAASSEEDCSSLDSALRGGGALRLPDFSERRGLGEADGDFLAFFLPAACFLAFFAPPSELSRADSELSFAEFPRSDSSECEDASLDRGFAA